MRLIGTLLVCLAGAARAAGPFNVRLEIAGSDGYGPLTVELIEQSTRLTAGRADLAGDGGADLRAVKPGLYLMRIESRQGATVSESLVDIREHIGPVRHQLPERVAARPVRGTVSAGSLAVPRAAWKLAAEAQRDAARGKTEAAEAKLRRVIAEHRTFAEAWNNLGALLVRWGRYDEAAETLRQAVALDPSCEALTNLAVALQAAGHPVEAEDWAARAVAANPANGRAHYIYGRVLLILGARPAQVLRELRLAEAEVPSARTYIAYLERRSPR